MARKRGRPPTPNPKTDKLEIRLTPEEKATLKRAADKLGFDGGITEFVRDFMLGFATTLEAKGYTREVAENKLTSASADLIDRVELVESGKGDT